MVTGLARSGTTLLAGCLDHHPRIMCIADPMNEFFKGFMRYVYYRVEGERRVLVTPLTIFSSMAAGELASSLMKQI